MTKEIQMNSGVKNVSNFDTSEQNETNTRNDNLLQQIENNDQTHFEIISPVANVVNENYDINVSLRRFDIMAISRL